MATQLGIVVPCYNEQDVLPEMNRRLLELLSHLQQTGLVTTDSAVYFVDDGSKDRTWEIIESFAIANIRVHGIKLSRNQGHQNALLAGLFGAEGDAVVTVDADLQDAITVIEEMLQRFSAGCDIVYGVRHSRSADTVFKRSSAGMYYTFLAWMGVDMVYNHADFRLMSRRAIDALRQYSEVNLFLRGIIPL
ncbi:MAG TPA: glycosyltransferase family 2 protein, partial [Candidatus Competibacteraceae bacterium]|nr:glycosyltransferase family 2 protein [Candidatus Competibacteraceae bacterium]